MNTKLVGALAFTIGAAIGSLVTWKFAKDKYERLAQEDAESFREVLSKYKDELVVTEVEPEEEQPDKKPHIPEKPGISDYISSLKNYGNSEPTNYADISKETKEKGGDETMEGPYMISADEYGNLEDYEATSLNYYADKILADDWDNIINDVDNIVGDDNLEFLEDSGEVSIYVRNDKLKTDYEIVLDSREYKLFVGQSPDWEG